MNKWFYEHEELNYLESPFKTLLLSTLVLDRKYLHGSHTMNVSSSLHHAFQEDQLRVDVEQFPSIFPMEMKDPSLILGPYITSVTPYYY